MSKPNPIKSSDGMVIIVMVALILVLMLISSLALVRYSGIDLLISGNQRTYKQDFYSADSGVDIILAKPSLALAAPSVTLANGYTLPQSALPDSPLLLGTKITTKFIRQSNPPIGRGYSVNDNKCNYYTIVSRKNDQQIQVGAWKVFPKS